MRCGGQKTQTLKHSVWTTVFNDSVLPTAFEHGIVACLFTKKGADCGACPNCAYLLGLEGTTVKLGLGGCGS